MELPGPAVAVLGRYPRAGEVKTRLLPVLGPEGCRRLQETLLADTVWRMAELGAPVFLFLDGGTDRERTALSAALPAATRLGPQSGTDLGQRMQAACRRVLEQAEGVVVVGTDAPTLPLRLVREALDAVAGGATVFCPVEDGGYCLLGLRQADPALFTDIDWGTGAVMAQSLSRIEGRDPLLLEPWYDVDVEADLLRLAAELESDFPGYPERTASLLAELRRDGVLRPRPAEPSGGDSTGTKPASGRQRR